MDKGFELGMRTDVEMKLPPFDTLYKLQFDPVFESAVALRGGALSPDIYTDLDEVGRLAPMFIRTESRNVFLEPLTNVFEFAVWLYSHVPEAQEILSKVRLGYVCNPSPHAFVERSGPNYVLGVCSGFVDIVTQAVFSLFASPHAFTRIGEASQEVRYQFRGGSLDLNNVVDAEAFVARGFSKDAAVPSGEHWRSASETHTIPEWPRPFDPVRLEAAKLVVAYAVEFAFLHELSHLLCGHFKFLKDTKSLGDGLESIKHSDTSVKAQYFMEIDADSMAIQMAAGVEASSRHCHGRRRPLTTRRATLPTYRPIGANRTIP